MGVVVCVRFRLLFSGNLTPWGFARRAGTAFFGNLSRMTPLWWVGHGAEGPQGKIWRWSILVCFKRSQSQIKWKKVGSKIVIWGPNTRSNLGKWYLVIGAFWLSQNPYGWILLSNMGPPVWPESTPRWVVACWFLWLVTLVDLLNWFFQSDPQGEVALAQPIRYPLYPV